MGKFNSEVMIVIRIYTCMHLVNIGGHLVDSGSYKLESEIDPFTRVSLHKYEI